MADMDFMSHPVVWVMIALIFAGIFATVGFMLMAEIDSEIAIDANSSWNESYNAVVAGVGTGFSLYSLVPLMTVVGVVIALLVGAFAIKGRED